MACAVRAQHVMVTHCSLVSNYYYQFANKFWHARNMLKSIIIGIKIGLLSPSPSVLGGRTSSSSWGSISGSSVPSALTAAVLTFVRWGQLVQMWPACPNL